MSPFPASPRFLDALARAAELHRDQRRKGSDTPYLAHLLAVASLVLEHGGDEDEAVAALLHDAVEDQGGLETLEEIRRRFGERVAAIVAACSDTHERPKPPWRARKEAFLRRLRECRDPSVVLVVAADKLHNVRSLLVDLRRLGEPIWERFSGDRDGTLWYYRAVAEACRRHPLPPAHAALVEELERTVARLEAEAGTS